MSKALDIIKVLREQEDEEEGELNCGFAIVTDPQDVMEQNFEERRGREPNDKEWEQINKDVMTVERNAVAYLNKVLGQVRDEGHSDDDLIGSVWCPWTNKKGLEIIWTSREEEGHQELSTEEDRALYKGVSEIGLDAFSASFYFFNIQPEDMERLEQMFEK